MAEIVENYDMNNIVIGNTVSVKEEIEDHKVFISDTNVNISNCAIKTELQLDKCNSVINDMIKVEDEVSCVGDIKVEFDNGLFCDQCHQEYQDYCIKCRMLVHILNRNVSNTDNKAIEKIPKDILEFRDSLGQVGIFALKVIPAGVKFGPFTGVSAAECSWKIRGGKLIISEDKLKFLNWMRYINPAKDTFQQNLLIFQHEDKVYYRSIRRIQEGEELLVYFGKEYEDSLNADVEMCFIPPTEDYEDVFACTFCCLGFSSRIYLAKHKRNNCPSDTNLTFSNEEITQCPFCQIHLAKREYFDYHMEYCCEGNERKYVPSELDIKVIEVEKQKGRRQRQMFKCRQCNYKTAYKADLKIHNNVKHCAVKAYKCGACCRRFQGGESLKMHVENAHVKTEGKEGRERCSTSDYLKAKVRRSSRDDAAKRYKCSRCEFRTKNKYYLAIHVNTRHFREYRFKCPSCDYRTNYRTRLRGHAEAKHLEEYKHECPSCRYRTNSDSNLENHRRTKHPKQFIYKCDTCEYGTNKKSNLKYHFKAKHRHPEEFDYECALCDFRTSYRWSFDAHVKRKHLERYTYKCALCQHRSSNKSDLESHVKSKHLREFNYACDTCEYKTNRKWVLTQHTKTKHLMEFSYKCELCEYKTNRKQVFERHTRTMHLKEFSYKCDACDYKTNAKSHLKIHVKSEHLKEFSYECEACEYRTNKKGSLENHRKTVHLKEFSYECEVCGYKTNWKSNLKLHIKTKHL